jgi:undecaprenyl-diphosphatase
MWFGYEHNWRALAAVDCGIVGFFHDYGVHRPAWLSFWHDLSTIFSTRVLSLVAVAVIVVALAYRQFRVAVFLGVTVVLMGLVTAAAKGLVHRPRPATALDFESSSSFPSGHALSITVAVLALTTVLCPGLSRSWRAVVSALGGLLILMLMLARVILNVHYPSDVTAGVALGFLWYLLWVTVIPPWPAPQGDGVSVPSADR